jgi:acyl dehydratase
MRTFTSAKEILDAVGEELGTSEWVSVTQERVNTFADATGDHQWIHVDVERAQRESPFGGPIAHGYLSLSLLPMLAWQIYTIEGAKMGINYGSNKVRYPAPVPVGSRVRLRSTLQSADQLPDGTLQLIVNQVLEIEGHPKPAVVAETISRVAF